MRIREKFGGTWETFRGNLVEFGEFQITRDFKNALTDGVCLP